MREYYEASLQGAAGLFGKEFIGHVVCAEK